ncbi:MAG TPA: hypothetical protein VM283_00705, partial [Armatimonadota bacterium]|nr:hypothetical protein [Armatimonadota bacterium]
MSLYQRLGINLRKNVGRFPSWTARENTIVDLDADERAILEREGAEALDEHLRSRGMFAFPALDVGQLKDLHLSTCLGRPEEVTARIYVPAGSHLCAAGDRLCAALSERGCQPPEVRDADDFDLLALAGTHAIILGGAHESPAAAVMCDRYYLDADLRFPGPGGWLLRTVHNPAGLGHNVIHLAADESTLDLALDALIGRIETGADGSARADTSAPVGAIAEIHPGEEVRGDLGNFDDWPPRLAGLAWRGRRPEMPDPAEVEQLADWLAQGFDSGGPEQDRYNRGPMGAGNRAARLYMLTGQRRFLELFRALLWRLMQYHCNFPGGASYLSDYDFEIWTLMIYWDLLEEEDVFSDDERLAITNFLIASLRMMDGYRAERWPTEPGELRHNHETFPALSLHFGGRYFSDYYDLPDARGWLDTAEMTFTGPIESASKNREDANSYQWMVPMHKLVYDCATGRDDLVESGALERIVGNVVATTDNLGWPSDFGDAGRPIAGGMLPAALLEFAAGHLGNPGLQWMADRMLDAMPSGPGVALTGFLGEYFGPRRVRPMRPDDPDPVDIVALDDHIRAATAPQMPRALVFDKIALRDGWGPDGEYLLLDGYSVGSHFHHDESAVIRFTAAGRLWIVDNGYGKPSGEGRAGPAFSGRQRGPQDHNTLLVYDAAGKLSLPAPFSALLAADTAGPLSLVQMAQVGYGPVDWLRTVVWVRGGCFLLVDQANVMAPVTELRCQLNMLGEILVADGLLTCAQADRTMFVHFEPDTEVQT